MLKELWLYVFVKTAPTCVVVIVSVVCAEGALVVEGEPVPCCARLNVVFVGVQAVASCLIGHPAIEAWEN